jgi:hypothetical protein
VFQVSTEDNSFGGIIAKSQGGGDRKDEPDCRDGHIFITDRKSGKYCQSSIFC